MKIQQNNLLHGAGDSCCKIAVIGGGVSGVVMAKMLSDFADVTVFEGNDKIGGLVRCDQLPQGLYHKLGGHVFNTKSEEVSKWFWGNFDRDSEFFHLTRSARILLDDTIIGYPIEDHLYQMDPVVSKAVIEDLLQLFRSGSPTAVNFKEFLMVTFGKTLCERYFFPYNEKIWRCDLASIPLGWLEGKLPMPKIHDVMLSNFLRKEESTMVHSRFYYPKKGGSQFVVDRLAAGLDVRLGEPVSRLDRSADGRWMINGGSVGYDRVVYTGDIRRLDNVAGVFSDCPELRRLKSLKTRGITNAFCYCDTVSTSWLYLPEAKFKANRIIYTGAFSPFNNGSERMTCVVEFVYGEERENIADDLRRLPGNLELIALNHVEDAYVIQESDTRDVVSGLKRSVQDRGLFLHGRFAEWEYYNIDKSIEMALSTAAQVRQSLGDEAMR